ncbi:4928_t:CDS:10 [Entrophospora sp. SA101]|nr:922_t:CDS:10 [Entrophospora sp. SA101]CAJ0868382.1 4928_t:CDS:10 [Entrophospora sp. SA101]
MVIKKAKHHVVGRKIRSVQGRPGQKKQIGIEKRKKSLLVEMENKNKVGGFIDKRFGENDPTMSLEEKMLKRFTKERQLCFYLGFIDEKTVSNVHFGGFDDKNQDEFQKHKKSKNEVMKEIIAKSKVYKYERQLEKERDDHTRDQLDREFANIRQLLVASNKSESDKNNSHSSSQNKSKEKESVVNQKVKKKELLSDEKLKKDQEYDKLIHELAFEKRGRPTDRTKSEEEIALEEKEKLEKLERARKRRMEGLSSNSDSDSDDFSLNTSKKNNTNNRAKLEAFLPVLIDYVLLRAQEPTIPIQLINKLFAHIYDFAHQSPEVATKYFIEKITMFENNLMKGLRLLSVNSSKKPKNALSTSLFPNSSELFLLKILSLIFPTSDFHHPVVTPSMLLMCQYLTICPIYNGKDLVSGLFICNLIYEYQKLSQRIVPEALNFLYSSLVYLAPANTFKSLDSIPGLFPTNSYRNSPIIHLQIKDATNLDKSKLPQLNFFKLLNHNKDEEDIYDNDEFRVSLLLGILSLIKQYAKLYSSTTAFIELFHPVIEILSTYFSIDKFSNFVKDKINQLKETLERMERFSRESRKPLELQHHRPIPLPTFIPKFHENYSIDKKYRDTGRDQASFNKLKSQHKKERKGAIRELRKDSQFIARQKIGKIREKDMAYKNKIKNIMGILEVEQGEKKAYEKAKKYGKL